MAESGSCALGVAQAYFIACLIRRGTKTRRERKAISDGPCSVVFSFTSLLCRSEPFLLPQEDWITPVLILRLQQANWKFAGNGVEAALEGKEVVWKGGQALQSCDFTTLSVESVWWVGLVNNELKSICKKAAVA
jgi:hypothetical protein